MLVISGIAVKHARYTGHAKQSGTGVRGRKRIYAAPSVIITTNAWRVARKNLRRRIIRADSVFYKNPVPPKAGRDFYLISIPREYRSPRRPLRIEQV